MEADFPKQPEWRAVPLTPERYTGSSLQFMKPTKRPLLGTKISLLFQKYLFFIRAGWSDCCMLFMTLKGDLEIEFLTVKLHTKQTRGMLPRIHEKKTQS